MRLSFLSSLPAGLVLVALAAGAGEARSPVEPINARGQGVALRGYDPVAYFQQGAPVKGTTSFTHPWMGATWRFSSAENRDAFAAAPEKYAPQFGGYCAWAVSKGYTADADPFAWKIVDGKLYLNYNKGVQKKWEQELPKRIEDAERHWPALHK